MRIDKIVFDETTDYDSVLGIVNNKVAELTTRGCSCCSETELQKSLAKVTLFTKAASESKLRGYTIKYREAVKAAYLILRKFDC